MNVYRKFIENFAHPSGLMGRVIAWRLDISNRDANDWTVSLLDLQPSDCVLEVGFGSGQTLKTIATEIKTGYLAGVDSSPTMLQVALQRNAALVASGKVALKLGDMENLPYTDNTFDKLYAVQVINYLPDPIMGCREAFRVTRPGGRVALFFEPREKFRRIQHLINGIYHPYDPAEVEMMLQAAGYTHIQLVTRDFIVRNVSYKGYVAIGDKEPYSALTMADRQKGTLFEFYIRGQLAYGWSEWFEGLAITKQGNGITVLTGDVADQAALHGILARIRDLNIELISLRQL